MQEISEKEDAREFAELCEKLTKSERRRIKDLMTGMYLEKEIQNETVTA